jgi:hypothetical protein
MSATTEEAVAEIARRRLRLGTLETRNSDGLDFHEVAVWEIKAALLKAFRAGEAAGARPTQQGD